jgi:Flp pilus assembly protein TadG
MLFNLRSQKGAMAITIAIWLTFFIGITALAFDVGHLMVVRNELQNAADATALAGANCLNKTTAGLNDCTNVSSATINWTTASSKATSSIAANKSDGEALVDGTVQTGYWNVNGGTALQPNTLSPLGPCTVVAGIMTTACDKPAVMVTLSRASGNNGGPVPTFVASMFGGTKLPISARAVAVISAPGNVLPGTLIPQAINKCMFDLYWESTTNSPKLAEVTTPLNDLPQVIGQPFELKIGSSYHYSACESGQWTSFGNSDPSAKEGKDLVNDNNPISLGIGDGTYIQPGTMNSLYGEMIKRYPTLPVDVMVPVVNPPAGLNDVTKTFQPIVAFAAFRIDAIENGSKPYIQGHFIKGSITSGTSGIGPYYGVFTPPRLAH